MDLKIISVNGHGDASEEYVWMRVLADCDLGDYALADTTYDDDGDAISNKLRHFFWFPSKAVKAGERVSLRTGKGQDRRLTNERGLVVHRFYWNLGGSIWNDDGDTAVLFELSGWAFKKA